MRIVSPMATGNGAYVVHKQLEQAIDGYTVVGYNPWRTLFPPSLYPLGRDLPCDIVHTTPDYAPFHRRKGAKLVVTFHNYVLDPFMRAYSSRLQWLHYRTDLRLFTKRALARADRVTAVSQFIADLVREDTGYQGPIDVIYNGVDTVVFTPLPRAPSETVDVLFVGNLSRRKGAHLLPEIAARLEPGIRILYTTGLRGGTPLPESDNLVNIGRVAPEEMPQVYQRADILLFPTAREGFGLAAAEAMACGLPVVTSNNSALPELIEDGKGGTLCGTGDVEAYAEAINRLASSSESRQTMGRYNREQAVDRFSQEKMLRSYAHLLGSLVP